MIYRPTWTDEEKTKAEAEYEDLKPAIKAFYAAVAAADLDRDKSLAVARRVGKSTASIYRKHDQARIDAWVDYQAARKAQGR